MLNKLFTYFFAILCFLHIGINADAAIKETNTMSSITEFADEQTIVFFDITNTLYISSNTLGHSSWKDFFSERVHLLIKDETIVNKVINLVKNKIVLSIPKKIIEEQTSELITNLQAKHIAVLGCTAKHLSRPYADNFGELVHGYLTTLGINFERSEEFFKVLKESNNTCYDFAHGIIFTGGKSKGEAIAAFLKTIQPDYKKIIMIDDRLKNLQNAEKILEESQIVFQGYHYQRGVHRFETIDAILGIIQLQELMATGCVLTDEDAAIIHQQNPMLDYFTILDSMIHECALK